MRRAWIVALATLACGVYATAATAQERRATAVHRSAPSENVLAAARQPAEAARPVPAAVKYAENDDGAGQSDSQGRSRVPPPRTGGSSGGSGGGGGGTRPPATSSGGSGRSGGSGTYGTSSTAQPRQRYPDRGGDGSYYAGHAVPRGSVPGYPVYRPPYHPWYGSWYPWGFGSWGLGFYFWDPYWYGGWGYSPYVHGYGYAGDYYEVGSVRLLVKPRDAQVFVDGYYVGIVDEFDGTFQRLKLDEGPHRIEIRMEGFETLRFDVRITWDHTIKLRGVLQPKAP